METSGRNQLDELLSEDIDSIAERERSTFARIADGRAESLVLFGAGGLGRRTLAGLRRIGVEPLAFADNNAHLWHQVVDGVRVLDPREAVDKHSRTAVFVVTTCSDVAGHPLREIGAQLTGYGPSRVASFAFLYWRYADVFLPYFAVDLPRKTRQQADQVRAAWSLWADESSRAEYLAQVHWRLWMDWERLGTPAEQVPYFPDDLFALATDEVFVDCGAFDGDTVREFLKRERGPSARVIALEPDPANFAKLAAYVRSRTDDVRNRVVLLQLAAAASAKRARFRADGTAQSAIARNGGQEVRCAPLDEVLTGYTPTYIKMDIEGSEPDALAGARRTIEVCRPVLAVSVYHAFDHLWKLPLFIQSLYDDYRLFLRPHARPFWDLVCYAVPASRLTINDGNQP